jgi:hypothetical protein
MCEAAPLVSRGAHSPGCSSFFLSPDYLLAGASSANSASATSAAGSASSKAG